MNEQLEYDVSIVIPCYQEEEHILDSTTEIYKVMNRTKYKFEIIFVDDASTDKTRELILQIEKNYPDVKYIFHKKNIGKGGSIKDGVKIARGTFVGHLDIDLEVSPEYLPEILSEIEKNNDIVLIKRIVKFSIKPNHIIRDIAGIVNRFLVKNLLQMPSMDVQSGCKFFKHGTLTFLLNQISSTGWFFDIEILARGYYSNYRIKQIPGLYIRNRNKKSTVKLFRDGITQIIKLLAFRKKIMLEIRNR